MLEAGNLPVKHPQKPVQRRSRKLEVAVAYLRDNPDKQGLSGRELERAYSAENISYKTWNKAKGEMSKRLSNAVDNQ